MALNDSPEATATDEAAAAQTPPDGHPDEGPSPRWGRSLASAMSPRRIGALYVLVVLAIVFSVLEPDRFPTSQTVEAILHQSAVTGLVSLALVVPLAAGLYDLSVGSTMSLSSMVAAVLLTETGLPVWAIVLIGLGVGVSVGLLNAFVTVVGNVDSLIGTLGTGAIVTALSIAVSGNKTMTGPRVSKEFGDLLARGEVLGVSVIWLYVLVVLVGLGLLLEQTQTGRYWYAIGFDAETARLAGIRVSLLRSVTFLISGVIASFAGLVLLARLSSGAPGSGEPYLLPAFAAVFLGATQFRNGRFNAWGTGLAVLLVTTANYGLLLSSAPQWAPNIFTGVVLLLAVALTTTDRTSARRGRLLRRKTATVQQ